jgi:hypothetical protein
VGRRKHRRYGLLQDLQRWRRRFELSLQRTDAENPSRDVLWMPTKGPLADRLDKFINL